jgi:putative inorganic carbon (hco3(-)) transporter
VSRFGFVLYTAFMCSWFLHLPARFTPLGAIRADLLLMCALAGLSIVALQDMRSGADRSVRRSIWILVLYAAISIPLVEWPGSVLRAGFPEFLKAFVFYWFTVVFVTSPRRLVIALAVFVGCQTFRVLEPLYLHVTEGYWGSMASMAGWESMDRLSGAPFDVVNPNGLAYIVLTVLPFLHYLTAGKPAGRLLYVSLLPALIYTLLLTGSRSGLVGLAGVGVLLWFRSKHKVVLATLVVTAGVLIAPYLSADLSDRYRSIFDGDTKNAETAKGRMDNLRDDLQVAMRRPLFGHGLGTSREANANFGSHDQPSHNLYVEAAQEIGSIGLVLFLIFAGSMLRALRRCVLFLRSRPEAPSVLQTLVPALEVWAGMNLLFSFASYGLSGYEWYLAAGLTEVAVTLAEPAQPVRQPAASAPAPAPGVWLPREPLRPAATAAVTGMVS